MKNPLIPPGIDPANFRFVAQRFKHCATAAEWYVVTDISKELVAFILSFKQPKFWNV